MWVIKVIKVDTHMLKYRKKAVCFVTCNLCVSNVWKAHEAPLASSWRGQHACPRAPPAGLEPFRCSFIFMQRFIQFLVCICCASLFAHFMIRSFFCPAVIFYRFARQSSFCTLCKHVFVSISATVFTNWLIGSSNLCYIPPPLPQHETDLDLLRVLQMEQPNSNKKCKTKGKKLQ